MLHPALSISVRRRAAHGLWLAVLLCAWGWWTAPSSATARGPATAALSPNVVISQIYGGGGEPGAPLTHDFIELFNRGTTTVNLTGWSVQYAAARTIAWTATPLAGTLAPGQYYLIRLATGGRGTVALPAPDAVGTTQLDPAAGRVALVRDVTELSSAVECPTDPLIVDFVGYGANAVCGEGGTRTPPPSVTLAVQRGGAGCHEIDNNAADFSVAAPLPRTTTTALRPCNGIVSPAADLVLTSVVTTQTSSAAVPARGLLSVLISLRNDGAAAAANVIVSNVLPPGFTVESASNGGVTQGTVVTWPALARLERGAQATFQLTARAPDLAASGVNVARATADTFDPQPANNRVATPVEVLAGARFLAGDTQLVLIEPTACSSFFTIEARLTNQGFTEQPDNPESEFIAEVSRTAQIASCSATAGRCRFNSGALTLSWDGAIGVGETVVISIGVQIVDFRLAVVPFCLNGRMQFDDDNTGRNDTFLNLSLCGEYSCDSQPFNGPPLPDASESSAQKPGSILFFNYYSSSPSDPHRENTRMNITNTSLTTFAFVHLFFVSADTCTVSDVFLCLTPNQTMSMLASDLDPGVTGYMIAVVVEPVLGCPIKFNALLGDESVKTATGFAGTVGAQSFTALHDQPFVCDRNTTYATLHFDGVHYNQAPRVLAMSSLLSPVDGSATLLVLNRLGGDLRARAGEMGLMSGLVFDDAERKYSFTFPGGCQFREAFSATFPRTSPRVAQIVPGGHTGWLRVWANENYGVLGVFFNANRNNAALAPATGGGNLHALTLTGAATLTMPLVIPHC